MSGYWNCTQCGGVNSADSFQCRCGALNYGGAEIYEPAAKKVRVEESAPPAFDPFPQALVGKTFEVQGLNSKPELNGQRGVVRDYDFASKRYTIEISGRGSFKLNRDNLRDPTTPQATAQDPLIGRVVEVQGLVAKPELNGSRGVVKEFDAAAGRYTIEIEGGRGAFKLKPDNLRDVLPPVPESVPQPQGAGILKGTYTPVPGMPGMISKTVSIGGSDKGAIIGAQGKQINKIRQESGAHCTIDTPPELDTALLTIRGSLLQVEVAEKMVQECLSYQARENSWEQKWEKKIAFEEKIIEVAKPYIASVIGKAGANLRDMGDRSGCKIIFKSASEVDPSAPPDKQVCVVRGPPDKLAFGEQLVLARVAEVQNHIDSKPQAQSWQQPQSQSWQQPPPKKEPCEFHLKGFCGFGDKCKYDHPGPPGGAKKEVCQFYLDGFCGYGDQCRSAHPEPCKFFQSGWCGYGDECKSAHIKPPEKKEVCKFFLDGFCGYGDQCRSLHEKPEEKEVCKFFLDGWCGYGDQCKMAHPASSSTKSEEKPPEKEVCKFFQSGWCGFGDQCTLAHVGAPKSQSEDSGGSYQDSNNNGSGGNTQAYSQTAPGSYSSEPPAPPQNQGSSGTNTGESYGASHFSNFQTAAQSQGGANNANWNSPVPGQGGDSSGGNTYGSPPMQSGTTSNPNPGYGGATWNTAVQGQGSNGSNASDPTAYGQGNSFASQTSPTTAFGGASWNAPVPGQVAASAYNFSGAGMQGMGGLQGMVGMQAMAPPQMAPQLAPQMAPPQMAQPQMAQPQMTQPQMAPPQMTQPQMAPPQMTPQQMATQMIPPQMAPPQMVPPQMIPPGQMPQMLPPHMAPPTGWPGQPPVQAQAFSHMSAAGWTAPSMSAPNAWAGGCPGGWN